MTAGLAFQATFILCTSGQRRFSPGAIERSAMNCGRFDVMGYSCWRLISHDIAANIVFACHV